MLKLVLINHNSTKDLISIKNNDGFNEYFLLKVESKFFVFQQWQTLKFFFYIFFLFSFKSETAP